MLLLMLAGASGVRAQDPETQRCRPELTIRGDVRRLSVAPDGQIWLADTTGRTYHAADITGDFARGSLNLAESFSGFRINQITFIDETTAIATGDMWAGVDRTSLYRTSDGGATWSALSAGPPVETIESVHVSQAGQVWIGGTAGELRTSTDGGSTWTRLTAPFGPDGTTNAIAMASATVGFVGAREEGRIRTTTDGGGSWQDVAPPSGTGGPGVVERLGLVGTRLIAQVDGRVFQTGLSEILWRPFTEPRLVLFGVDRGQRRMAGLSTDGTLYVFDSTLTATGPSVALPMRPIDVAVADGAVYAIDAHAGLARVAGRDVTFTYPLTRENPTLRLHTVRPQGGRLAGVSDRHVYTSSDGGERWCRVGHVPEGIAGMAVQDADRLLLWNGEGSNVLFDVRSGSISPVAPLAGYAIRGVAEVGGGWLAYGRYDAASGRAGATVPRDGRTMPALNSAVLLSRDRGISWTPVDGWPEQIIDRLTVTPGGDVVLLAEAGAVRRLPRAAPSPRGGSPDDSRPYGPGTDRGRVHAIGRVTAFYFVSESVGYVAGSALLAGSRFFRTADGGGSWTPIAYADMPFTDTFEAGGRRFGVKGSRVLDLQGRPVPVTQAIARLLPGELWSVSGLSAREDGTLLVEMTRGDRDTAPVRNLEWAVVPPGP